MTAESLLEVQGLSKVFGRRKVLDRASLRVRRGEAVGLLGRKTAGESTILRMLAGLLKPGAGSIRFRGEKGSLLRRLTVEENLLHEGRVLKEGPPSAFYET